MAKAGNPQLCWPLVGMMEHDPRQAAVRAFAERHGLTEAQARRVFDEHGADESAWDEAVRNLIHFLRSPS